MFKLFPIILGAGLLYFIFSKKKSPEELEFEISGYLELLTGQVKIYKDSGVWYKDTVNSLIEQLNQRIEELKGSYTESQMFQVLMGLSQKYKDTLSILQKHFKISFK